MSDTGTLLELMSTSSERWRCLRMAGFEWRDLKTLESAWEHHVSELRRGSSVMSFKAVRVEKTSGASPPSGENLERWQMWLAKPHRRRAQFLVGDDLVTAVFVGGTWWSFSPRGFITNHGAPNHSHGFGPGEGLLDSASHVASLDMRVDGRISFLSRPAVVVVAVPRKREREGFDRMLHMLGTGADRYELVVDAEVGILLRSQANFRGKAFRVIEADQFGVDEEFDARLFDPDLLRAGITDP